MMMHIVELEILKKHALHQMINLLITQKKDGCRLQVVIRQLAGAGAETSLSEAAAVAAGEALGVADGAAVSVAQAFALESMALRHAISLLLHKSITSCKIIIIQFTNQLFNNYHIYIYTRAYEFPRRAAQKQRGMQQQQWIAQFWPYRLIVLV